MFFTRNGKEYTVEVNRVFQEATPNDYYFDLEDNGVKIKGFSDHEDFTNCTVWLFYNPIKEQVTIQLEREEYEIITDVSCTREEQRIISAELSD